MDTQKSNELLISSNTWNKLSTSMVQSGFREGAGAGRDAVFQDGFDIGYSEGFLIGLSVGYVRGVLSTIQETDGPVHTDLNVPVSEMDHANILKNPLGDICQLCLKEEAISTGDRTNIVCQCIDDIVDLHRLQAAKSLQALKDSYSNVLSEISLTWK